MLFRSEVGSSHGYNVVSWREGDVVYQLVTDLDEQDIRDLMPPQEGQPVPPKPAIDVRPAAFKQLAGAGRAPPAGSVQTLLQVR